MPDAVSSGTDRPITLSPADLEAFCARRGVMATMHRLSEPTPTVPAAAAAIGVTPEQIVKSLLFLAGGQPVLVVAAGHGRVRYSLLARATGVGRKQLRFATPEQAIAITGYPVGAMPAFGHRTPLTTYVDDVSVPSSGALFMGGGGLSELLEVDAVDLLSVSAAQRVALTEEDEE